MSLLTLSHDMSFDEFAIVTIGTSDYIINFWFMTKSTAVDRMENTDLSEEKRKL